jgi:FkbM family methyltransferase
MTGLKKLFKQIPVLGPSAVWASSRLKGTWRMDPRNWLPILIPEADAQVVQIGSNDGRTDDPIYQLLLKRKSWKALFVEPVPYLYERLKRSHPADLRFHYENSAINDGSNATFYWVDESAAQQISGLPEWHDQLGSFDRQHIVKHLDGILEPFIISHDISGITLRHLFEKHAIRKIDLLHIDTEGHDYKVLSQLDLTVLAPSIILFEHKHLASGEREKSIQHLAGHYQMFDLGSDFLAVSESRSMAFATKLQALKHQRVIP